MSDRISEIIVLCEDDPQARLVREYLRICGQPGRVRSQVAAHLVHGGNVGWVIRQFPAELYACRQRSKRSRTLLIVMIDADEHSVEKRRQQLLDTLIAANLSPYDQRDPAVLLIPKRQVETWIRSALGEAVDEQQNCKASKEPAKDQCRRAARAIYALARPNANIPGQLVPSLVASLPEWRRIC